MNPIGAITSSFPALPMQRTESLPGVGAPALGDSAPVAPAKGGFGSMLDGVVNLVDSKEATASAMTNSVMLGQSGNLHQSVIAMQEASVALSLMVQVRNKLVESYQELMRMQV